MDPFAAIGLASAIVQFVDFSCKLISEGQELYRSADGALKRNIELTEITTDLKSVTEPLAVMQPAPTSPDEVALQSLAVSCRDESKKLLKILENLEIPKDTQRKTWHVIRQTLQSAKKRERIGEIETRLEKLRDSNRLSGIALAIEQLDGHNAKRLDELRVDIVKIIEQAQNPHELRLSSRISSLEAALVTKLNSICDEGKEAFKEQVILDGLQFPFMTLRHSKIAKAHRETFKWILESRKTTFTQWLEGWDDIYWIAGKPGSGKSTLMKFINSHDTTQKLLRRWAAPKRLVIGSYYFWINGTTMQKSQEGLLQTLLRSIFRECPGLIPLVCPERWNNIGFRKSGQWDLAELSEAFEKLVALEDLPAKFCFFVDGLDEYDGGDPKDVIQILDNLAMSSSIKICVSSREYTVFRDAYAGRPMTMYLEDLTANDIRKYVRKTLEENSHFREIQTEEGEICKEIVNDIVKKAKGVFLWVFLIVNSLTQGLERGDDVSDMKDKVKHFPDDLKKVFQRIFDSVESVYREQMARIFQVAMSAVQPLPVLAYALLDTEKKNSDYALHGGLKDLDESEINSINERMRKRLNERCKDLMEISEASSERTFLRYKVDFLHRTVRDFLETKDIYQQLEERAGAHVFEPRRSLCRAFVGMLKALPLQKTGTQDQDRFFRGRLNDIFSIVDEFNFYARQCEERAKKEAKETKVSEMAIETLYTTEIELIDEVDRVLCSYAAQCGIKEHWTNLRDPPAGLYQEYRQKTYMASVIQARLHIYVSHKLSADHHLIAQKKCRPLLDYALRPAMITPVQLPPYDANISVEMVTILLSYGTNPNQKIFAYDSQTVWQLFLLSCLELLERRAYDASCKSAWYEAMILMLRHGAGPNCTVVKIGERQEAGKTLWDVADACFIGDQLNKLRALIKEKQGGRLGELSRYILGWTGWGPA